MNGNIKNASRSQLDMTRGSILKQVVLFAVPLLIGNLFQQLYNTVDAFIIGVYGSSEALAAVGTGGSPVNSLLALFLGIGTGATILVSQAFGAGEEKRTKDILQTSNAFILLSAIPITVIGVIASPYILKLMQVPDDTFSMANTYVSIVFLGSLPLIGYNLNSGILRGMGDSRSPLLFLLAATISNIFLDLLFVAVFNWGVAGVAIATVIAQFVAWIFSVFFIKAKYPQLGMRIYSLIMDKRILREMIRLGLPMGLNNCVYSFGHMILQSLVNSHGSLYMAGYTTAARIDGFTFIPITSFGMAASTFAGQNVGAQQHERLNQGIKIILVMTVGLNVLTSGLILIFGKSLISMFNQEPAVIEAGYNVFLWMLPFYWIFTIFNILNNYMNGAGEVRLPTISSMLMFWVVRLPLAFIFSHYFGKYAICACYPISWTVGLIISGSYFLKGNWKRHYLNKSPGPESKRELENTC